MKQQGLSGQQGLGLLLVFLSALTWSFGGAMARSLETQEPWTIVFWRALFASLFLLGFMLVREGPRGTIDRFTAMGLPGAAVGLCFATASISFVVALSYTTVANILLIQAGGPLIAALLTWVLFRERPALATVLAIVAVVSGIAVMVSGSLSAGLSPVGDALAVLICVVFAAATVITRRFAHVVMLPACCLGTLIATALAALLTPGFAVSTADLVWLIAFGAFNLGLGMVFFVTGARLIPATIAALIGTAEPVLGPLWVWLAHDETPTSRTFVGGAIVLGALLAHIAWQASAARRAPSSAQA